MVMAADMAAGIEALVMLTQPPTTRPCEVTVLTVSLTDCQVR